MVKKFYDTNVLLRKDIEEITKNKFVISTITLAELENIKNDSRKDFSIKVRAQNVSKWLAENEKRYEVCIYNENLIAPLKELGLEINNDAKIIACALAWSKHNEVELVTGDLNMYNIAKTTGLRKVSLYKPTPDTYKGYEVVTLNDEEMAYLYEHLDENIYKLHINEYLQVYDTNNNWVAIFKWNGVEHVSVQYPKFKSRMLGDIKPLDKQQYAAMDSLLNNQMTMLRGPAGSGKSHLACAYLFQLLEKGDISKIVILVNTPAAKGACKLGFYPGSKDEKLLSSTVGNILSAKLGSMDMVEMLIGDGKLELIPIADLRGVDFSDSKVGVWIVEAQNTSRYLMQLCLQRLGDDSIMIIDGDDATQVDMSEFAGEQNGMKAVSKVFRGCEYYGEVTLDSIHRSKIAAKAQEIDVW